MRRFLLDMLGERTPSCAYRFIIAVLSLSLVLGCEGDAGPAGPPGAIGPTAPHTVEIVGSHPFVRADGVATIAVTARVTTENDNRLVGALVSFAIATGSGSVSPAESETNQLGEASTTYTVGADPGDVVITAQVRLNEWRIGASTTIHVDPLSVSLPLLQNSSPAPLQANWSADGTAIAYQTDQDQDARVFRVSAQGGEPSILGAYRGGVWNPGTDRIAVISLDNTSSYYLADTLLVIDQNGNRLFGPAQPVSGRLRVVGWAYGTFGGDSLLSSRSYSVGVTNLTTMRTRFVSTPVSIRSLSPVPRTSEVVLSGVSENVAGIFVVDLDTGQSTQVVAQRTSYYGFESTEDIRGAAVDNQTGDFIVFSQRPATEDSFADHHDLYKVAISGGEPEVVFTSPADELYPQWSPDGQRILFCSDRSGNGYNLYVLDLSNP